jgi:hypothetical protein
LRLSFGLPQSLRDPFKERQEFISAQRFKEGVNLFLPTCLHERSSLRDTKSHSCPEVNAVSLCYAKIAFSCHPLLAARAVKPPVAPDEKSP